MKRALLIRGPLSTRLVVAGAGLLVGLPTLSILAYTWGYPAGAVPLPVVIAVDGLQILIVLNAVVVLVQLVRGRPRAHVRRNPTGEQTAEATPDTLQARPLDLRELTESLAEAIWEHERRSGTDLRAPVLDYIRDAVMAELEYRRGRHVLARRLADLEERFSGRSAAGAG